MDWYGAVNDHNAPGEKPVEAPSWYDNVLKSLNAGVGDEIVGAAETALTLGTGMVGLGTAGLGSSIAAMDPATREREGGAINAMRSGIDTVTEKMTYQPRGEEGQRNLQAMGKGMEWVGDKLRPIRETSELITGLIGIPNQLAAGVYAGSVALADTLGPMKGKPKVNALSKAIPKSPTGLVNKLPGERGGPAYHGTPHKFDEFSTDAIGTGEGAQAYGHGLYFAENAGVAGSYRKDLSEGYRTANSSALINGEPFDVFKKNLPDNERLIIEAALNDSAEGIQRGWFDDLEWGDEMQDTVSGKIRYTLKDDINGLYGDDGQPLKFTQAEADSLIDKLDSVKFKKDPGHTYEVEIPDAVQAKMLDWDKPLSEQPESVRKALIDADLVDPEFQSMTGEQLYRELQTYKRKGWYGIESEADISAKLNELGIPGIRYLDGRSRGMGAQGVGEIKVMPKGDGYEAMILAASDSDWGGVLKAKTFDTKEAAQAWANQQVNGTRNIVLFDPKHITSTKRDGVPTNAMIDADFAQTVEAHDANIVRGANALVEGQPLPDPIKPKPFTPEVPPDMDAPIGGRKQRGSVTVIDDDTKGVNALAKKKKKRKK